MKRSMFVGLFLSWVGVVSTWAATNSWKGGDGFWERQNRWSLNKRPAASQDILITNAGTYTVTVDSQTAPSTLSVRSLSLGNPAGTSWLLVTNLAKSSTPVVLNVLNDLVLDPNAILLLGDGSKSGTGVTVQALRVFNDSFVSVERSGKLIVDTFAAGTKPNAVGTLMTSNGSLVARSVWLGTAADALGEWEVAEGTNVVAESLTLGSSSGTGIVQMAGGRLIVGGTQSAYPFSIGGSAGSTGTVMLVNGQIAGNIDPFVIGEQGVGSLIVSNGSFAANHVQVGVSSGARGRYLIANGNNQVTRLDVGGSTDAAGEVVVTDGNLTASTIKLGGLGGPGSLTVSNGVVNFDNLDVAPNYQSTVGTLTVAGGNLVSGGILAIKGAGTGVVWQTGGNVVVTSSDTYKGIVELGRGASGGTYHSRLVCSGGLFQASEVFFGREAAVGGVAVWEVDGGTSTVDRAVYVLSDRVLDNRLVVHGGLLVTPFLGVGYFSTGSTGNSRFDLTGGTVRVTSLMVIDGTLDTASEATLSGGELIVMGDFCGVVGVGYNGLARLNIAGGTLTAGAVWLGYLPGSSGTLNISGGMLDTISSFCGLDSLVVGKGANSTGSVQVTGGELRCGPVTIGDAGIGEMSIASSALSTGRGAYYVARQDGSRGKLTIANNSGTVDLGSSLLLAFEIGRANNSTGEVWLSQLAMFLDESKLGDSGSGRLVISNSAVSLCGLAIGNGGTLEVVNCQIFGGQYGCQIVNSNLTRLVNSEGYLNGSVNNGGTILVDGGTITFYGFVQNDGLIIATNSTVSFPGGLGGSGTVLTSP